MQRLLPLTAALSCLLLASCASSIAQHECEAIVQRNTGFQGLVRLQQLVQQTPESGECMKAYLLVGERVVAGDLRQADRLSAEGQGEEAARLYRRVMELQPGNDFARQGLRALDRKERQRALLEQARRAVNSLDRDGARALIDGLLRADPGNVQALEMRDDLARQTAMAAPRADDGLAAAFRKPITLDFRDIALRQIFEVLSRSSGLNFVFDKDVKVDQKTSIFLRESTVESALYFLLLTNQLEHQVMNGNTVLIYPNAPAKLKDYQELSVRTFHMANTDVKSVAATLKTLFKGRDVVVDEKLNMLVVRDTPDAIRLVEKLVALHDVAEPEVMLEVAILEVSRKKLLNLGVSLPGSLSLAPLASNSAVGLTLADLRATNSASIGAAVGGVTFNLAKENTDVNILANPRIRVVNREKAKVLIGERVPVVTVTTSPTGGFAESVSYVEVGLKLDVEPTIYRGNDIVIRIGLEVSNISGSTLSKLGGVAYTFGTRTANTTLRLRDGENQVLAGLINDEDRKAASKVPGLGDLPVAGRLFGSQQDDGNKTEIMLSITPRLVRNTTRADTGLQEFRSGTENNLRERPGIIGRVQVPAGEGALVAPAQPAAPLPAAVAPAPPVALPQAAPAAPVAPARAPVEPAAPAVTGMPTVNITSSPAASSGAGMAGKATGIRSDEAPNAK